jgi:GNAT superfamily N-acetyltransferase
VTPVIEQLDADRLDRLEPLWLLLHAYHQAVAPELGPYVDDAVSWKQRRALYEQTLAGGGFALLARDGGRDLGYAISGPEPRPWPATLATADEVHELHTILISEDARGRGVGSRLLDAVERRLEGLGAKDQVIGAVAGNVRAIALYGRRGFLPTWMRLTRFGRPPPAHEIGTGAGVEVVPASEVGSLEALWLALHRHNMTISPGLAPFVSDSESWEIGRRRFAQAASRGHLLRVGPATEPIGVACFEVSREDPFWGDTWRTGVDVAEINALVIAERERGRRLGTALLDAIDARLQAAGIFDQAVGVIAPDHGAVRMYEHRGFRPTWLDMTRLASGVQDSQGEHAARMLRTPPV